MIVLFLTGEEAQLLRDAIGPTPGELAPVARQLEGFSREVVTPNPNKPKLALYWHYFDMTDEIYDEPFAQHLWDALQAAHRTYVAREVPKVKYRKRRKVEATA